MLKDELLLKTFVSLPLTFSKTAEPVALIRSGIICAILVDGIMKNIPGISCEIILNLDQWFR